MFSAFVVTAGVLSKSSYSSVSETYQNVRENIRVISHKDFRIDFLYSRRKVKEQR